MNLFDRANHALRHDLEAYAQALDSIVTVLPRVKELCDHVVKETRLARALLAFTDNQQMSELNQLAFHLTNLWPYREQAYTRTVGFGDEIDEAQRQREEALRAVRLLARLKGDPLAIEVSACFSNIATYLEEERALLAECHALIQPHASNMDMTRKRLNLLVAMVDARLPASEEQAAMLFAYQAAAAVLADWENGVPLEERGVEILTRCLRMLEQVGMVPDEETDEVYVDAVGD
jgi:hypothetical protein